MGKPVLRTILGVLVGGVAGMVVMTACHIATMPLYPPPAGVDMMNPDHEAQVHAWMETLPDTAFVVAMLCHWIGTAAGAAIAMLIAGRRTLLPALLVGALFALAGLYNVTSVPHPAWFPYVDVPGYLAVALLMGRWLLRKPAEQSA